MKSRHSKGSEVRGSRAKVRSPESSGRAGVWSFGFPKGADLSRRAALWLLAMMVVVWLVAGSYLALVAQTAVAARRVQALREELALLQRENAVLERRLAEVQAVGKLYRAAEEMGLAPAERVEFVEP